MVMSDDVADRIDERPAHAIENRCAHHPRAVGFVDLRQILVREVVDDEAVIERMGMAVLENRLKEGACPSCATAIPGVWS